jgi:transcriptional regulator with XRE-family HTH domain
MTYGSADVHIDQMVKAGWLAIGLSQRDLAEVLGATFQQAPEDSDGSSRIDPGRLMQVAEALELPADLFYGLAPGAERDEPDLSSTRGINSLQSVLALRLLRAFQHLTDLRSKGVLILLAEQIVKCQADRSDGG